MTTDQLIEALNLHIQTKRKEFNLESKDFLVIQNYAKPHEIIKALHKFTYIVWVVTPKAKHRLIIVNKVANLSNMYTHIDPSELIWEELTLELEKALFDWIGTETYKQVINGTYGNTSK